MKDFHSLENNSMNNSTKMGDEIEFQMIPKHSVERIFEMDVEDNGGEHGGQHERGGGGEWLYHWREELQNTHSDQTHQYCTMHEKSYYSFPHYFNTVSKA